MTTLAQKTIIDAHLNLGVHEKPKGSNWGPEIEQYLASCGIHEAAPWCAAFVRFRIVHAAAELGVETQWISGEDAASSTHVYTWAKKNSLILDKPVDGCVFVVRTDPDSEEFHHTALVETVEDGMVKTLEGNSNSDGSAEGYEVVAHQRPVNGHLVFIKIV